MKPVQKLKQDIMSLRKQQTRLYSQIQKLEDDEDALKKSWAMLVSGLAVGDKIRNPQAGEHYGRLSEITELRGRVEDGKWFATIRVLNKDGSIKLQRGRDVIKRINGSEYATYQKAHTK